MPQVTLPQQELLLRLLRHRSSTFFSHLHTYYLILSHFILTFSHSLTFSVYLCVSPPLFLTLILTYSLAHSLCLPISYLSLCLTWFPFAFSLGIFNFQFLFSPSCFLSPIFFLSLSHCNSFSLSNSFSFSFRISFSLSFCFYLPLFLYHFLPIFLSRFFSSLSVSFSISLSFYISQSFFCFFSLLSQYFSPFPSLFLTFVLTPSHYPIPFSPVTFFSTFRKL